MRFLTLAVAAAVTGLASGQSMAADLPVKAPAPVVASVYNWSGFYLGLQGGYGWSHYDRSTLTTGFANGYDGRGGIGGIYGGYNWQWTNIVAGIEADYSWGWVKGDDNFAGGSLDETTVRGVGTVRGRLGYASNQFLAYVTGGWAYANLRHSNTAATVETFTRDRSGGVAGAGFEYGFLPNWSARLEYRYHWLGTFTNGAPTNGVAPYEVKTNLQTLMAGVSYRFGRP